MMMGWGVRGPALPNHRAGLADATSQQTGRFARTVRLLYRWQN